MFDYMQFDMHMVYSFPLVNDNIMLVCKQESNLMGDFSCILVLHFFII